MKLILLIVGLSWLSPIASWGQSHTVRLRLTKATYDAKSKALIIIGQVQNDDSTRTFLKPQGDRDFCLRLSYAELSDKKTKRESHYFPCKWVADLDRVAFTQQNTIEVPPNGKYSFTMKLKTQKIFSPLIPNHSYKAKLRLNHHDICGGQACKVFTGSLTSNDMTFLVR